MPAEEDVTEKTTNESDEIRIGISTCLLGQEVRFDGGHKHDRFVTGTLGRWFTFIPVCPEVEVGMGIPRETVRLVSGGGDDLRMLGGKTEKDWTTVMNRYAQKRVRALEGMGLHGYLLKKGSPSCGMERVKVYTPAGMPVGASPGLFARALMEAMPLLPVEEEGRLNDPILRENFIERVFAYKRLRDLFDRRWTRGDLVAFHSREKVLLLAHEPKAEKELGRIVAEAKGLGRAEVAQRYPIVFMKALARKATKPRHANAFQHMLGHFKKLLGTAERAALATAIEDYRNGLVPLVVPVTLFRHYVELHNVEYLDGQTYLSPHPKELLLRNHV
jgi:uncharacterized protein YbgA (DUF1722 family)/uncharacterized protein YbbK (DUF523 family)